MPQLVGQRTQAENGIAVAHHDERMRALCTPGECALSFAPVGVDVNPTLVERPLAQRL